MYVELWIRIFYLWIKVGEIKEFNLTLTEPDGLYKVKKLLFTLGL